MNEKNSGLKSNLQTVDNQKLSSTDYADIPKLPDIFFTEGQLYRNGNPVERRTRKKKEKLIKKHLTIKLNDDGTSSTIPFHLP